ncbi:hypothetical protein DB347_10655 [Opitutaceae bacterium EW11]|nr:hypothetical protein DB347_10655 [Opitutaceae bacterium EW11]
MPQTVQPAPMSEQTGRAARGERWETPLLTAGAVLFAVAAKLRQIGYFGSDIPRGDPWSGDAAAVLLPYLRGTLGWADLFAAHNEHRVVFTRLESLFLLAANGQWDARLEQVFNAGLHAAALAVVLLALRKILPRLRFLAVAGLAAVLFGSSASWENTLGCFQSQFYFMLLFSFAHLAGSLLAPASSKRWWGAQAIGFFNLFTMAGGLFSAAAVAGVAVYQRVFCRSRSPGVMALAVWNAALVALGLLLLPHAVPHAGADTLTLARGVTALGQIASWPLDRPALGILMYAPVLLFLGWRLVRPADDARTRFFFGLAVLSLVHLVALAFSRGGMASRYVDLAVLGLLANVLCWWELPAAGRLRQAQVFLGAVWLSFVLSGVWAQEWTSENATLRLQDARDQARATAIREYLRTSDIGVLRRAEPVTETNADVLASVLSLPEFQRVLPAGIRLGLPYGSDAAGDAGARGFTAEGAPALGNSPRGLPVLGTWSPSGGLGQGEFLSGVFRSDAPYLSLWFAGELSPDSTELALVAGDGRRVAPLAERVNATDRWVRINFENPGGPLRLAARDASATRWMAFSEPVETARLSWWAGKLLKLAPAVWFSGAAFLVLGGALALRAWFRGPESVA